MPERQHIPELDPKWLTRVLRDSGVLTRGNVTALLERSNPAFNSRVVHLTPAYSKDAEGGPAALFLKLKRAHEGRDEVAFYRLPESRRLGMIPRCYLAEYSQDTGRSVLLLHDYSESHQPALAQGVQLSRKPVPERDQLDSVIDALAELHGAFWEDARLGGSEAPFAASTWWRDQTHFDALQERWRRHWIEFESRESAWLPTDLKQLFGHALDSLPRLWERRIRPRVEDRKAITLIHGDCYFGQFLVPRPGAAGRALVADLDSVCAGFGALDLVYLMTTFWNSAQRHRGNRERELLQHYHESLAHGYAWTELVSDYRLMLSLAVFTPIWDYSYQGPDDTYWWTKLQCLVSAYRDWKCGELA